MITSLIDTVVFDLGRVLVDFDPEKAMQTLGFSKEAFAAFQKNIFSGFWESCDAKIYTHEGIRQAFKERVPGYEAEVDRLWDNLPVITGVRPYVMEWLRDLKARGLKLYVLSNYGNVSFELNSKGYDFLSLMDGMVISYELEIVKPDPRIYEELFRRFQINPETAVFIDDRQANIDGAIRVGMKGILFEDYEEVRKKVEEMVKAR